MISSLQSWANRLKRAMGPEPDRGHGPRTNVGEITPCCPRESAQRELRLNLFLPSINARHYFGGIHTAVLIYRELCRHFGRSRVVLVDSAPDEEALDRFADHALSPSSEDGAQARQIVPFNDRYGRTLPVGPGDVWLGTAWWTVYAVQRLAHWQESRFGRQGPVAYLIQDFEPGFYPWSSHAALALSTYRPQRDLGIFNTRLLSDYFGANGLAYEKAWVFEPTLNTGLRDALTRARREPHERARRILVYGRPSTPRNAFELICEGLRAWGWNDVRCKRWEVVAPGELEADLDLGPLRVRAVGKLPIADYGDLLASSAVGLSMMISPHPSYPPLEMAAFGMRVLTNRFANKDLEDFSPNITSVDTTPDAIAAALTAACDEFEAREMRPLGIMESQHPFLGEGGFAALADELALALIARCQQGR